MDKCTRNFYEESVTIRRAKLVAAEHGYDALMAELKTPAQKAGAPKTAVIRPAAPQASLRPISLQGKGILSRYSSVRQSPAASCAT